MLEAIGSIAAYCKLNPCEVIIVDDGSNQVETIEILKNLESEYTIIHQENKGPGAARNTGVKIANGQFILFLDSDNRLLTPFIDKALNILNNSAEIGVVYGNPSFFGGTSERFFYPEEFSLDLMILGNYIDVCSIIRKKVWEDVGGFDDNRELSQEDWEFWIRVGKANWKFYHIKEATYEYRIRSDSHVISSKENYQKLLTYVYTKHMDLVINKLWKMDQELQFYKRIHKHPFRTLYNFVHNRLFTRRYINSKRVI